MRDKIIEFLQEYGISFKEKRRTITDLPCPDCGREDKFSILKENGSTICYRGSCSYGKKWFTDFMVKVAGITPIAAKHRLYGNPIHDELKISFDDKPEIDLFFDREQKIQPIQWPENHMLSIVSEFAPDGMNYLKSRGIPPEIATKHKMMFSPKFRRVYIPVIMNHNVYGYQGRAIDNVPPTFKVRNNQGFQRDKLVMFLDCIQPGNHVIIAEGPFDALKFDLVGGAVCTMGKQVTQKQIDAINSKNPTKVYLALDDDAANEMNELVNKFSCPIYRIEVPQSCKRRCAGLEKKADFGECSFEEARQAFLDAYLIDSTSIILYME